MNSQNKKTDILLVMAPPWETKMPPLGLAYIASYINSRGFNVKVIDFNAYLYNKASQEDRRFWEIAALFQAATPREAAEDIVKTFDKEIASFIAEVLSIETKLIGFSVNLMSLFVAGRLAEMIKRRDKKRTIIFGGPGCFWDFYRVEEGLADSFKGLVDIFVIGEGEKPLANILTSFYKEGVIREVPGTLIYRDGKYIGEQKPDPVKKLATIPSPTFKEFDLSLYSFDRQRTKVLPLLSSRGCPRRCSFCVDYKMCNPYRWREPKNILEEVKFHIKNYGCTNFLFNDLKCNGNLKQLEAFCDLVIASNLKFGWSSYAVIRKDMSLELLKKMKEAGCSNLCYGMDSASDKVLKMMNKPYSGQDAEKLIRLTHRSGIRTAINVIIGHPGEDASCFRETVDFLKRNKEYIDEVTNVSTLFINATADLGLHPEKYGIGLPSDNWNYFYDHTGNNFEVRMKRLKKLLLTLYKFEIPHLIINHYPTKDKKLREIINKLDKAQEDRNSIIRPPLRLTWGDGQLKLHYQGTEVTKDVGLNTSFRIDGRWRDSSQIQWQAKKVRRNRLTARIEWNDPPLIQTWHIALKRAGQIDWKVDMQLDGKVKIEEWKVGLMASEKYQSWVSNNRERKFPQVTGKWQEMPLADPQDKCLELRSSEAKYFPNIVFDFAGNRLNTLAQIQNCPRRLNARMLNVRIVEDENSKNYFSECMHFSVKIGLKK